MVDDAVISRFNIVRDIIEALPMSVTNKGKILKRRDYFCDVISN